MNWWPIAKNLHDYLIEQDILTDIDIHVGPENPITKYPCMEIICNKESGIEFPKYDKGKLSLYIDCWVENGDTDLTRTYELQYNLQISLLKTLNKWMELLLEKLGMALKITIGCAFSDESVNNSVLGCRTNLDIEWRKVG